MKGLIRLMRIRAIALCLTICVAPGFACTADAYDVTVLQDAGLHHSSEPTAINASGESVGYSDTATGYDAVLWSATGNATILPDAGGEGDSAAYAINAAGYTAGSSAV